jgi:hypothetical protein
MPSMFSSVNMMLKHSLPRRPDLQVVRNNLKLQELRHTKIVEETAPTSFL